MHIHTHHLTRSNGFSQSHMHLRESSVQTHTHCRYTSTPDPSPSSLSNIEHLNFFLGVIDGWQNIPQGAVIKQEVKRVTEQSRSWLTPPSQQLTDLLLQRRGETREKNEREP